MMFSCIKDRLTRSSKFIEIIVAFIYHKVNMFFVELQGLAIDGNYADQVFN